VIGGTRVAVVALLGALVAAAGPAVPARATVGALSAGSVRVSVSVVSPPSPGPGDTFVVAGRVINGGGEPIQAVGVRLLVDPQALTSRDDLAQAAAVDTTSDPALADSGGDVVSSSIITGLSESLAPNASVPFQITIPADDLALKGFGVHVLTVEARAAEPTGQRTTVASLRTFIVWRGSASLPTLRTTWLVPLQDQPLRGVDGRYDPKAAGALADSLDSGGRLSTMLEAGEGEPVSWAVDPDLLEEAQQLSVGAPLVGGGTASPDDGAANWLRELSSAQEVLALPYADPDLTAQRRGGLSFDLAAQVATGTASAARVLNRTVPAAPAWPVDGVTTSGTIDGAAASGLTQVVLSSGAVRAPDAQNYTPDALGPLAGSSLQSVTADATLSSFAAADPRLLGNATLARLRLLAETAMIAAERPSQPRSVVIALPRDWAPSPGWARVVFSLAKFAPWLQPTTLSALTADPGDAPLRRLAPYPDAAAAAEVPSAQFRIVRTTSGRLDRFQEILTQPAQVVPAYSAALMRAQSAAWQQDPTAGTAYAAGVAASLQEQMAKVRILPRGEVTLSSRTGKVPLAVRNELDQDVRLQVRLTATPAFRLRTGPQEVSTVPAGRAISVEVPASTSADGRIPVTARLVTPSGTPFGQPVSFEVRATGYGAVAQLAAGALVVLLAIALVVRVVRRIRRGAGAAAAARDVIEEARHG